MGQTYLVPCVAPGGYFWPVLGPKHEDAELIGFDKRHYHYDIRFLSNHDLTLLAAKSAGIPGFPGLFLVAPARIAAELLRFVLTDRPDRELGEPVLQPRRCHRSMPHHPELPPWIPALEERYRDKCLKTCGTCPHKGLPLHTLAADADGVIECPGHQLRWRKSTGELVPQAVVHGG